MNFANSKTSDPHRLLFNLLDEINLKRSDKYVGLSNLSNYKNIKKSQKNNQVKISVLTWNKEFELPDGSYSVSDIQKKQKTVTDNPSKMIYVNKKETRIKFKIKAGYYLELSTPETIKLIESTKGKLNKDENGENVLVYELLKL